MDRADIRVVQRGRSLGLPLKTAKGLRIVGEFVGKELQGNVATQLEVFRFVHHAHPSSADLADYVVVGDGLADHSRGTPHPWDEYGRTALQTNQLNLGVATASLSRPAESQSLVYCSHNLAPRPEG